MDASDSFQDLMKEEDEDGTEQEEEETLPLMHHVNPEYELTLQWTGPGVASLWQTVPWAQSTEQETIRTWARSCGIEAMPLPIARALLAIDTALVRDWDDDPTPPLFAYPVYSEGAVAYSPTGRDVTRRHHPAWVFLALRMAIAGEDLSPGSWGPLGMLSSTAHAKQHFRLIEKLPTVRPALPKLPESASRLCGTWELINMSKANGTDLNSGWRGWLFAPKGRIVYSSDGKMAAQVTYLRGLIHVVYAGYWNLDDTLASHLCLANNPMAGLEDLTTCTGNLSPLSPASSSSYLKQCLMSNYGSVRSRFASISEDGNVVQLTVPAKSGASGLVLTWRRVEEFQPSSGGRWSSARG